MALVHWHPIRSYNPMHGLTLFQNRINQLFDEAFRDDSDVDSVCWSPLTDVIEIDDRYEFSTELPGMRKEDVKVELNNNVLSISGEKKNEHVQKDRNVHLVERGFGNFCRTFRLPSNVKAEEIQADYKNGILKISLPKAEDAKPKQIEISVD